MHSSSAFKFVEYPGSLQLSHAVSTVVEKFPTVISDLVASYLDPYADACMPLTFDKEGKVTNPEVVEIRMSALISCHCSPVIKAYILGGEMQECSDAGEIAKRSEVLRDMCKQIANRGYAINIDGVVLKKAFLHNMNFTRMSAIGSQFFDVEFSWSDLTHANLTNAEFVKCALGYTNMTGTIARGVTHKSTNFYKTIVAGMITDDPAIQKISGRAVTTMECRVPTRSVFILNSLFTTAAIQSKVADIVLEKS